MATRSVQFTGARTGKTDLVLPRYGRVHAGDVLDVPEETAEAWTRPLPTADGEAADFAYADVPQPKQRKARTAPPDEPAPVDNPEPADSAESERETL